MNWRRFFRRVDRDAETAREIQFYLDEETGDNIARGMPPKEARAAAYRKLGNSALIREEIYRMNSIGFLETTWQDLRYALRTMRKSPAFALTAVLTLAIGIGGNTAMFSVIRAVLLKPLEYRDPGRLVRLSHENLRQNAHGDYFTLVRLEEMRSSAKSFAAIGAFLKYQEDVSLSGHGEPAALKSARVSANFLDILKMKPLLGRSFLAEEDKAGGAPVAMISARLWRSRFQADPRVAGQTATLNATPYTIIGVLPDGFVFPFAGTDVWFTRPEEWSVLPARFWAGVTPLYLFARLKPQVSLAEAQAEADVLNRQYILAHPERPHTKPGITLRVASMKDQMVADVRPMLWMLFGAII
ncbi:MAG: ABC transporter permease [Bryobacteraceae bacterium]